MAWFQWSKTHAWINICRKVKESGGMERLALESPFLFPIYNKTWG